DELHSASVRDAMERRGRTYRCQRAITRLSRSDGQKYRTRQVILLDRGLFPKWETVSLCPPLPAIRAIKASMIVGRAALSRATSVKPTRRPQHHSADGLPFAQQEIATVVEEVGGRCHARCSSGQ